MAVRDSYLEFVVEQLSRVREVSWRRMFGGVGIYAGGVFFAVLDNDSLFFKTDETTRPEYEARGLKPFQPFGPDTQVLPYHEVPADVLENVDELARWMSRAVAVAEQKRKARKEAKKPRAARLPRRRPAAEAPLRRRSG
ncbi:MAG TPA: TfoX/Sxy family protein [Candidatus Limnocylindria bacterium]|jgi:DNA transformation protein|nr:TfoX/Sxy family protein [Candidatus Limnocylindria bacterium]